MTNFDTKCGAFDAKHIYPLYPVLQMILLNLIIRCSLHLGIVKTPITDKLSYLITTFLFNMAKDMDILFWSNPQIFRDIFYDLMRDTG